MESLVEMADLKVTNDPTTSLVTSTLGSGVAVAVYDPQVRVGGMLHFILPEWEINKKQAQDNPSIFANCGIPNLYRRCYKLGADKARMKCYVVGGADVIDGSKTFSPGQANLKAALEILKQNGVTPAEQWVGGTACRVIRLFPDDGRVEIETRDGMKLTA